MLSHFIKMIYVLFACLFFAIDYKKRIKTERKKEKEEEIKFLKSKVTASSPTSGNHWMNIPLTIYSLKHN